MSGIFDLQSAFPPGTEPGTIFNPLYVFLRFKKTLNLQKKDRLVSFNLDARYTFAIVPSCCVTICVTCCNLTPSSMRERNDSTS